MKIREIKTLLEHEGLTEAAKEASELNEVTTRKDTGTNRNKNSNKKSPKVTDKAMRNQGNSVKPQSINQTCSSLSMETIYQNAVPVKDRNSSLSDEVNETDTSDELINLQFESMNVMDGYVVDHSRRDKSRWRECDYGDREHSRDRNHGSDCE